MAVASPKMEDSIHSSPSAAKLDADTASETSSAGGSDRNYQSDSSVQRRRDIEPQTISRSEEYRLLFHLPPEEVLIQDFNCALQENILLQGHMYLFMHHICFYSNIFGFETKKVIHFFEVTCVRKAKTAAIFPNAIEMVAGGKKIFFASFLSRDEAYRLIVDGWSQHNGDVKVSPDNQELKSETESLDSVPVLFERSKVSKEMTNEVFLEDRNKDIQISEQCKALPNGETDFGRSINLSPQENGEEEIVNCSSPGELLNWEPEDVVAPRVPEYYTPVAESKFWVSVEDFFSLFLSDADFIGKFHRRCGEKDFKCSSWYKHEQSGNARDLSFQHPVKIYFVVFKVQGMATVRKSRDLEYTEIDYCCWICMGLASHVDFFPSHLVVETLQNVSDVPYADYFCVEGIWDVEEDISEEGSCCILRVYTNVAFSKKTMWKGKIEQSTIEECREAYAVWINMAHEILKEKKLSKLKGISGHAADLVQDTDVTLNSYVVVEGPSLRTNSMKKSPRNRRSDSVDLVSQFEDPAGIGLGSLSIIVLLTRTPEINIVVPRENNFNSFSSDRAEAVAWLEKRVYHLKEDMLMVESRLEIMRREYALLKDHLQAL
ncbi:hypothetical protein QJS10_CPA10g00981 [Acorus calamus]|uniref:VASt domain-containing protein n=1 Tax=Acorus calamus TaxID=4465 RepID=A0AAV9E1A1_ACOCL|nr:hypothetical protein QJS10_CPA10g00981 [Acorus calamus]